jgi:hypothetical protein
VAVHKAISVNNVNNRRLERHLSPRHPLSHARERIPNSHTLDLPAVLQVFGHESPDALGEGRFDDEAIPKRDLRDNAAIDRGQHEMVRYSSDGEDAEVVDDTSRLLGC